jgi:hypothetical protein
VAAPWVPVFGLRGGRWLLAGEVTGRTVPGGAGGQPWDGGPVAVVRSARVVAVLSAADAARGPALLRMAEAALDRVTAVRPAGWSGRVLVTAVQDARVWESYFAAAPEWGGEAVAIAVSHHDHVSAWRTGAAFAATRVVFNPSRLAAEEDDIAHDLIHEFTHVAMDPVTGRRTPRWLVEGIAEYVSYRGERPPAAWVSGVLADADADGELPGDDTFYRDGANYAASWVACKMVADRYGEARLFALFEAARDGDVDAAARRVLGVGLAELTAQWRQHVQRARATGRA